MNTTITITYESDMEETKFFQLLTEAVKYAESIIDQGAEDIISVMLKGEFGEREFVNCITKE